MDERIDTRILDLTLSPDVPFPRCRSWARVFLPHPPVTSSVFLLTPPRPTLTPSPPYFVSRFSRGSHASSDRRGRPRDLVTSGLETLPRALTRHPGPRRPRPCLGVATSVSTPRVLPRRQGRSATRAESLPGPETPCGPPPFSLVWGTRLSPTPDI